MIQSKLTDELNQETKNAKTININEKSDFNYLISTQDLIAKIIVEERCINCGENYEYNNKEP